MTYAPYEMSDDSPDLRSPALRQAQRAEFHDALATAHALNVRGKAEGWSEERRWGERLPQVRRGRQWTSAAELGDYLAEQWAYWNGRAPTEHDRAKIDRTAHAMWASRASERVVPPTEAA
jgi:hypothetical protein